MNNDTLTPFQRDQMNQRWEDRKAMAARQKDYTTMDEFRAAAAEDRRIAQENKERRERERQRKQAEYQAWRDALHPCAACSQLIPDTEKYCDAHEYGYVLDAQKQQSQESQEREQ